MLSCAALESFLKVILQRKMLINVKMYLLISIWETQFWPGLASISVFVWVILFWFYLFQLNFLYFSFLFICLHLLPNYLYIPATWERTNETQNVKLQKKRKINWSSVGVCKFRRKMVFCFSFHFCNCVHLLTFTVFLKVSKVVLTICLSSPAFLH